VGVKIIYNWDGEKTEGEGWDGGKKKVIQTLHDTVSSLTPKGLQRTPGKWYKLKANTFVEDEKTLWGRRGEESKTIRRKVLEKKGKRLGRRDKRKRSGSQ